MRKLLKEYAEKLGIEIHFVPNNECLDAVGLHTYHKELIFLKDAIEIAAWKQYDLVIAHGEWS